MRLMKFEDFVNERWAIDTPIHHRIAAGVAIIYDNKILLVRPSVSIEKLNDLDQKEATQLIESQKLGIPKGKLDSHDEDPMEAALRELEEETSIRLTSDMLDQHPLDVHFYKNGKFDGRLIYFLCEISDLNEIGLTSLEIPSQNLQAEEVNWGGFLSAEEAYPLMSPGQMLILDRHLNK